MNEVKSPKKPLIYYYLAAILLAFTNGYEIIRGHLCQVGPKRGGDEA